MKNEEELASAFDEIIEGKFVNRIVHDLNYEGRDFTRLFIVRLKLHGFIGSCVNQVELQFEERVPAFAIRDGKAYFGWVFIERFTEKKSRKLFGSLVRNKKGDWLIQISDKSREQVYVNCNFKSGMEGERLFVME